MRLLCECMGFGCDLTIEMSVEEGLKARAEGKIIIVAGCSAGPEDTDTLIEEKEGYSIYKEKK